MSNTTIAAARRQLTEIQQTAAGFEQDLVQLEHSEAEGEPLVSCLTVARMLIELDDLRERLSIERDRLTEATGDLDVIEPHQHDGRGGVAER